MTTRATVEHVLDRVRPAILADGGDIQLVELEGDVARIRLTGVCATCPTSHMTLHMGVETALRRIHPSLRVEQVS